MVESGRRGSSGNNDYYNLCQFILLFFHNIIKNTAYILEKLADPPNSISEMAALENFLDGGSILLFCKGRGILSDRLC